MSDDTTHYKGCGVWNSAHARCCSNDELIEALGACVEEAYSAGLSDGHPLNGHDRRAAERRRTDLRLYLAEVRRRIGGEEQSAAERLARAVDAEHRANEGRRNGDGWLAVSDVDEALALYRKERRSGAEGGET